MKTPPKNRESRSSEGELDVYKRQDMDMGVAGSLVVDGKVSAHPLVHKVVLHIGPDKGKLLLPGQKMVERPQQEELKEILKLQQ